MKNIKFTFCLLAFVFCWFGCGEKERFPYQLTNEKFVEIITDLHISESAAQHLTISYRDSISKIYLDQILEIHEVPTELFDIEYEALRRDPEKLAPIYDLVIKRLNELKSKKKKETKLKGEEAKQGAKKR